MRNRFFFGGPKERVFLQRVLKIRDPREAEYVQLMHDFGHYSGFRDLKKTVIVERLVWQPQVNVDNVPRDLKKSGDLHVIWLSLFNCIDLHDVS